MSKTRTSLQLSLHQSSLLEKREKKLRGLIASWARRLERSQNRRLFTALFFFASMFPVAMRPQARWELLPLISSFFIFLYLVGRTRKIHRHIENIKRLLAFTERQKNRCLGLASGRPWEVANKLSEQYPLIRDIGLMGSHSLWTLIDESISEGGLKKLLQWMSTGPENAVTLQERQKRIASLRPLTWFYTRLGIAANSNEVNLATHQIHDFIKNSFVQNNFHKLLLANLVLWLLTLGFAIGGAVTGTAFPAFIFLPFPLLSLSSLGVSQSAFLSGVGLSHHLGLLAPVFAAIEKRGAASEPLRNLTPRIHRNSPSKEARKLDLILGFVGTQTNPILHLILNFFTPWTLVSVYFLERLRKSMIIDFPVCSEELSELEALGSLALFEKYQTQTYPELRNETRLSCIQLYHPLLERRKAVANDFEFPDGKSLGLLTGSNMSGKSTFLRTMGLNQTLANMGAPVFADRFATRPFKIETCIEVTDSLRDGYSYFYAEVRRLRHILETASSQTPVLYLVDEIFRGTNNKERQIGSAAVIRSLADQKTAIGFISTHDLELTVLEDNHPSLLNLHFREDIDENGKMVFYYHLRPGPCPTTNALRIMQSEGIQIVTNLGTPRN